MKKNKTEWVVTIETVGGLVFTSIHKTKRLAVQFAEHDIAQYKRGSRSYRIIKRVETIVKETK